jgi:FlaA1/EpsC-like NDP-sugar epimerase
MTPRESAQRAMALTLLFDMGCAAAASIGAHLMLWLGSSQSEPVRVSAMLLALCLMVSTTAAAFIFRGVPKQVWRHLSRSDAYAILQATGLAVLLYLPVMMLLNGRMHEPFLTLALTFALFTFFIFAGRSFALERSTDRPLLFFQKESAGTELILLAGDEISLTNLIKRLEESALRNKYRILGIIETDEIHTGRSIRGVSVLGRKEDMSDVLGVLTERYGKAPVIGVTGAARQRAQMMHFVATAAAHGTRVMAFGRDADVKVFEPVDTADLLARPERRLDPAPVVSLINGARILVTGGGGTIGSELTRQVAAAGPAHLAIVDASEFNLYEIELWLTENRPDIDFTAHLGDVRDPRRLEEVFADARPDVVIHAAALKHVPLMERHVNEAVLTNVAGAIRTARAAAASGARRFVFISTDKAVDPDNVMGATKRLAEMAIARIAAASGLAVSIVRFGNVLGSSGSVVPLFERQIERGGPVTITHPDATRYFMTREEAASLVLQAAALQDQAGSAELFVLDMGEPIKIGELAETMIRLKGQIPHEDIKIVDRGLREGEKMHEALTYAHEDLKPTKASGVNRAVSQLPEDEFFDKRLEELLSAALARETDEVRRLLGLLVPEYQYKARRRNRIRA